MWTSIIEALSSPSSRGDTSAIGRAHPSARARRVSARKRRRLVESLRRAANHRPSRDPARRRFQVLIGERVHLVRSDLLEIATLLERAAEPDPECVRTLHRLLTDGCESPLYNPDIHPSELRATLYYLRARLAAVGATNVSGCSVVRW
jgi:hypothetical protein